MKARNIFIFGAAVVLVSMLGYITMYKHVSNIVDSLRHTSNLVERIAPIIGNNSTFRKYLEGFTAINISSVRTENSASHKPSQDLGTTTKADDQNSSGMICPQMPSSLTGRVIDEDLPPDSPWAKIDHTDLEPGGKFAPKQCKSRYKVAIIIPQRDRLSQLRRLLTHLHPVLKRQQIEYQIYVISQIHGMTFNRGKLMNVGAAEAIRDRQYDCYIFHDVDLFPINDHCMYSCDMDNPRHLAMYMDKFNYKKVAYSFPCAMDGKNIRPNTIQYFGGVSMVSREQYNNSNGYSNMYWGWGGEDDDFYVRLRNKNYTVVNPYGRNCSYNMIKHKHESSNPPNPARFDLLKHSHSRISSDGYSSLKYEVVSKRLENLFTNITVDIGRPPKNPPK